jgi:pyrroline-5-carboxylate reductase
MDLNLTQFGNMAKPAAIQLGFIGGGVMAEAIFSRLIQQQILPPSAILVSDPVGPRRDALVSQYGVQVTAQNLTVIAQAPT